MNANTKSILFFLLIYMGSMSIFGSAMGYLYYQEQKGALIQQLGVDMRYKVKSINARLEYYHNNQSETFTFYDEGFDIALYDIDRNLIASTFNDEIDFSQLFYSTDEIHYYLVESLFNEYLGVKYIVVRTILSSEKLALIKQEIFIVAFYGFLFMLIIALLLSKVMLYPVRRTMNVLKTFIKDTTHEMNTPISTILMSYEHLDKSQLNPKQQRALNRIEIAAKNLSSLYNDLSFASFHEHIEYEDTPIDVKEVLLERTKYFDTLVHFKDLNMHCEMEPVIINMDKRKLVLIIDNLLSNAIKFSKKEGSIDIHLTHDSLTIKDNGIGISAEDQKNIFKRFKSGKSAHAGFGVGLDIVYQICKEYGITILLNSELHKGSEFILYWPQK